METEELEIGGRQCRRDFGCREQRHRVVVEGKVGLRLALVFFKMIEITSSYKQLVGRGPVVAGGRGDELEGKWPADRGPDRWRPCISWRNPLLLQPG